ncbi:hypothetical protein R3P38DRAFT_3596310 [Favolaschia claudopus]|uniref:Uncharacterized protein n=1 Tax=Favolaschia claudopus TaxID=2862362 RepID=A0AAW0AE71_9AGAR
MSSSSLLPPCLVFLSIWSLLNVDDHISIPFKYTLRIGGEQDLAGSQSGWVGAAHTSFIRSVWFCGRSSSRGLTTLQYTVCGEADVSALPSTAILSAALTHPFSLFRRRESPPSCIQPQPANSLHPTPVFPAAPILSTTLLEAMSPNRPAATSPSSLLPTTLSCFFPDNTVLNATQSLPFPAHLQLRPAKLTRQAHGITHDPFTRQRRRLPTHTPLPSPSPFVK